MRWLKRNWLLLLTHVGALVPLSWLLWDWFTDNLTVNPIKDITLRTGKTALILLILTLAITPIITFFRLRQVSRMRRWLGLYAFFYALLHFLVFVWLDYGFDPVLLREAILEKRFALAGFAAFLILLPLALTSTRGWMRRLGKNWKRLHRMVYLAAGLVVVHYLWQVKSDIRPPLAYGAIIAILLVLRIPAIRKRLSRWKGHRSKPQAVLNNRVEPAMPTKPS